jgi:hypothetical protein
MQPSGSSIHRVRFVSCLLVAAAGGFLLPGCSSGPEVIGSGPQYPPVKQARVIDVQVLRDETVVTMTNTTAADLPAGLLWINAWFSRPFEGLKIGQTVTLRLASFEDRFGMPFRAGGFFAVELPDRLVLAQVQPRVDEGAEPAAPGSLGALTPGYRPELIGLVVIRPVE